jgi:hypothetical protein
MQTRNSVLVAGSIKYYSAECFRVGVLHISTQEDDDSDCSGRHAAFVSDYLRGANYWAYQDKVGSQIELHVSHQLSATSSALVIVLPLPGKLRCVLRLPRDLAAHQ